MSHKSNAHRINDLSNRLRAAQLRNERDRVSRSSAKLDGVGAKESLRVPEGSESQKQKCDLCAERKLRCILKTPKCRHCEIFELECSISARVGKADDLSRYEDKFCNRCMRKGIYCSGPPKPKCKHCHESGRECSFQRSQSLLDKEETVKRASFVEEPATLSKMHDLTHLNQMDESGPREIEAEHKHHQSAPLALLPKSRVDAIKCVVGTHDKLNEGVHVKDPHKDFDTYFDIPYAKDPDPSNNSLEDEYGTEECSSDAYSDFETSQVAKLHSMDLNMMGERVLRSVKRELAEHVMDEFTNIFDPYWADCTRRCPDSGSPASRSAYRSSAVPPPGRAHGTTEPTRQGTKRSLSNRDSSDDGNEDGAGKRPNRDPSTLQSQADTFKCRFACPFQKRNPLRYQISKKYSACCGPGFSSVHRMKEHLYRNHRLPIHCPRCKFIFKHENELTAHQNADQICERRETQLEGLSAYQERDIRYRMVKTPIQSEEEKWRHVYRILFPGDTDIPTPYFQSPEAGELLQFIEYSQRELPSLISTHIDTAASQWNQPLEEVFKKLIQDTVHACVAKLISSFQQSRVRASSTSRTRGEPSADASATPPPSAREPTTTSSTTNAVAGSLDPKILSAAVGSKLAPNLRETQSLRPSSRLHRGRPPDSEDNSSRADSLSTLSSTGGQNSGSSGHGDEMCESGGNDTQQDLVAVGTAQIQVPGLEPMEFGYDDDGFLYEIEGSHTMPCLSVIPDVALEVPARNYSNELDMDLSLLFPGFYSQDVHPWSHSSIE